MTGDYIPGNIIIFRILQVFHILYTKPLDNIKELRDFLILQYISALTIEKTYGSISIVTDYKGKNILKELGMPYSNYLINLNFEKDNKEYFSTAKVDAIKSIVDFNENFLYLDCDVFINKKINNKFNNIVQADEGMSPNTWGLYKYCKQIGINFTEKYNEKNIRMCNMGVFKSNKHVIYQYYDSYMKNLNLNLFFLNNRNSLIDHPINFDFPFTIFLEQTLIYEIFKKNNLLGKVYQVYETEKPMFNKHIFTDNGYFDKRGIINSNLKKIIEYSNAPSFDKWFDTPANIEEIDKTKFIHLAHYKNNKNIIKQVKDWGHQFFPEKMKQFLNKLDKI